MLYIEDAATGELFVSTEVLATGPNTLEPVTDSFRYYVMRVVFGGKAKFIGLGFNELFVLLPNSWLLTATT